MTGEKGKGETEEEGEGDVVRGVRMAEASSAVPVSGCDAMGRCSCDGGRGMGTGTPESGRGERGAYDDPGRGNTDVLGELELEPDRR